MYIIIIILIKRNHQWMSRKKFLWKFDMIRITLDSVKHIKNDLNFTVMSELSTLTAHYEALWMEIHNNIIAIA